MESPARGSSITAHISYLHSQVPKVSVCPALDFPAVMYRSIAYQMISVTLPTRLWWLCSVTWDRTQMKTPRAAAGARGCCVGYQQHLSPVFLQCTLPWAVKEDVTLQRWNISPDAAVIRTDEHPWGPAWLSFKSAGAELIPLKQNCICAAARWWIWLFSLSLTTKEERDR